MVKPHKESKVSPAEPRHNHDLFKLMRAITEQLKVEEFTIRCVWMVHKDIQYNSYVIRREHLYLINHFILWGSNKNTYWASLRAEEPWPECEQEKLQMVLPERLGGTYGDAHQAPVVCDDPKACEGQIMQPYFLQRLSLNQVQGKIKLFSERVTNMTLKRLALQRCLQVLLIWILDRLLCGEGDEPAAPTKLNTYWRPLLWMWQTRWARTT